MKFIYTTTLFVLAIFIQANQGLDCFHCFKVNIFNDNYKNSAVRPIHEKDDHLELCDENIFKSKVITCPDGAQHCIFVKMEGKKFTAANI